MEVYSWEAMETHRSMLGRPPTQAARVEAARRPRSPESPEPSRRGPGSVEPWSPPDKNAVELLKKVVGGFKLLANYGGLILVYLRGLLGLIQPKEPKWR